jgi:hypothetical protein
MDNNAAGSFATRNRVCFELSDFQPSIFTKVKIWLIGLKGLGRRGACVRSGFEKEHTKLVDWMEFGAVICSVPRNRI